MGIVTAIPERSENLIRIVIDGQPQGKARARTTRHGTYTLQKTVDYENLVKYTYLQENSPKWQNNEPLEVEIIARYEIPKGTSKANKQKMLDGLIYPTKKPDADNIAKIICDALNKVAYNDDSQIVSLNITKEYSEIPCVIVLIDEKNIIDL